MKSGLNGQKMEEEREKKVNRVELVLKRKPGERGGVGSKAGGRLGKQDPWAGAQ